jgi:23S rRNA pseudouridine2605 synthase
MATASIPIERLSKFLSNNGVASRRKVDEFIKAGKVRVNGKQVLDPFFRIDSSHDWVTVDGKRVIPDSSHLYIALNKPVGYLSDLSDPRRRQTARTLIHIDGRLYPVGRLDYNSEGLMVFTNDGMLANMLMHPRYGIAKEYLVKLSGHLDEAELARMVAGIRISGDFYRVTSVTEVKSNPTSAWYRIVLSEGKNRMIRRIADALNHPVVRLKRIRIDGIKLGNLKPGHYRLLTGDEIGQIRSHTIHDQRLINSTPTDEAPH